MGALETREVAGGGYWCVGPYQPHPRPSLLPKQQKIAVFLLFMDFSTTRTVVLQPIDSLLGCAASWFDWFQGFGFFGGNARCLRHWKQKHYFMKTTLDEWKWWLNGVDPPIAFQWSCFAHFPIVLSFQQVFFILEFFEFFEFFFNSLTRVSGQCRWQTITYHKPTHPRFQVTGFYFSVTNWLHRSHPLRELALKRPEKYLDNFFMFSAKFPLNSRVVTEKTYCVIEFASIFVHVYFCWICKNQKNEGNVVPMYLALLWWPRSPS